MLFPWLKSHHRHKILEEPFPEAWLSYLHANVPHYDTLSAEEQTRLRDDLRIFIAEKNWEGCDGLTLTDEMKVTIAAYACLLVLNREHDFYPNVESILVYPAGYRAKERARAAGGVVEEGMSSRLGEAWSRDLPVVLSWFDTVVGVRNPEDGHNVVIHEFAHKLDFNDGDANGVPLLDDDRQVEQWAEVMSAEYEQLVRQSEHGHADLLDTYGATNPAEFFAVATECFFEKPRQLLEKHHRLYETLSTYFHQDPAARVT